MSFDILIIAIAMFTWGIGEGLFLNFQPIYLQQLGADPLRIGVILSGFGFMMTISHIPAGYLSDRFGRKPLMIAAWILGLGATLIMALAPSLEIFVTGMLLYGLTMFVLSPLNSYITVARGRFSVGRIITFVSACFNLGAILGPWIGGQIGERLGLRYNYWAAAGIFVISTAVIALIRPQPVETPVKISAGAGWGFNRGFTIYLWAVFLAAFAIYLPQPFTPNFLQNQRDLSLEQIGLLFSMSSIGVVILNLLIGQLPARLGFLLGQAAVGLFTVILLRGIGLPVLMVGFFLLGGFKTARALASAQVRDLVFQERIGLAYGLTETVGSLAFLLAPLLAGYIYLLNPTSMYGIGMGLIMISLVVSFYLSPHPATSFVTDQVIEPVSASKITSK